MPIANFVAIIPSPKVCEIERVDSRRAITVSAELDDGMLDTILLAGFRRRSIVAVLARVYRGRHLGYPGLEDDRVTGVSLRPRIPGTEVLIDLDGEQPDARPRVEQPAQREPDQRRVAAPRERPAETPSRRRRQHALAGKACRGGEVADPGMQVVHGSGIVADELYELRTSHALKDNEIDRLNRENTTLREDVRRLETVVFAAGRRRPRHPVGHPNEQQMSFNQADIDELFNRCSSARRRQPQDQVQNQ